MCFCAFKFLQMKTIRQLWNYWNSLHFIYNYWSEFLFWSVLKHTFTQIFPCCCYFLCYMYGLGVCVRSFVTTFSEKCRLQRFFMLFLIWYNSKLWSRITFCTLLLDKLLFFPWLIFFFSFFPRLCIYLFVCFFLFFSLSNSHSIYNIYLREKNRFPLQYTGFSMHFFPVHCVAASWPGAINLRLPKRKTDGNSFLFLNKN